MLLGAGCSGGAQRDGATALVVPQNGIVSTAASSVARLPAATMADIGDGGPSASGFTAMGVSFEHSLISDDGVLIANYAKAYGIHTIFAPVTGNDILSLDDGNPTAVKDLEAMIAVAKVYIVSGSTDWLATPNALPPDVVSLEKIARIHPNLGGILYRIDPEQLTAWNSSQRSTIKQEYFTLLQTLVSDPGASAFHQQLVSADIDFATERVVTGNTKSPTMLQQIEQTAQIYGTVLITPGNSESTNLANVAPDVAQMTKPFRLMVSTSPYDPGGYFGVTPQALQSNLSQLRAAVAAQNPLILGIAVNGWSDLYDSLQSVLPQPPVFNGTLPEGRSVPPPGTTYLGGYVNAAGTGQTEPQTVALENQIGRPLAYNLHFYGWQQYFPGYQEKEDVLKGRIPVIAWNCGDSDANVAAGNDDAIIIKHATAIKKFHSMVFLRWFWEMNLNDENNAPRTQCYDPATDWAGGYFAPRRYIAAWDHIHRIFEEQGVDNVVWLWCVADAHGGSSQYYPGDDEVDWIGMDDYDTRDTTDPYRVFFNLANMLGQFQEKPLMLAETGAHADVQAAYLSNLPEVLKTELPQVRAMGYFDSKGDFQDWGLTDDGLQALTSVAHDPYFSALAPNP